MKQYRYRYVVKLSEQQRRFLKRMTLTSRTPAKHYVVARALLMSAQSQGEPNATDEQIAEALSMYMSQVSQLSQSPFIVPIRPAKQPDSHRVSPWQPKKFHYIMQGICNLSTRAPAPGLDPRP